MRRLVTLTLAGGAVLFAASLPDAFAGVGGQGVLTYPVNAYVGQTSVPVTILFSNGNTTPHSVCNDLVSVIFHTPSCVTAAPFDLCSAPELGVNGNGVFAVNDADGASIAAVGIAGNDDCTGLLNPYPCCIGASSGNCNGCAGINFTALLDHPATGRYVFTPTSTLSLPPGQFCVMNFAVDVIDLPASDAHPLEEGLQTHQLVSAQYTSADCTNWGGPGAGQGSSQVTVDQPCLHVEKSCTDALTCAGDLGVLVTATNCGTEDLVNVTITDPLLPGLSCSGTTLPIGGAPITCSGAYQGVEGQATTNTITASAVGNRNWLSVAPDATSVLSATCSTPLCPSCGDGTLDAGEQCDDGNAVSGDGCDANCTATGCGNGVVTPPEECDDGNGIMDDGCDAACQAELPPACGAVPQERCRPPTVAGQSVLLLKDRIPDRLDLLKWRWTKGAGTLKADFGNPLATTNYTLCVYDEVGGVPQLKLRASVPPGGMCGKGPCWKETARGYQHATKDASANGIVKLQLREGYEGRASITLQGEGARLAMPALPMAQAAKVIVQLKNDNPGVCWGAVYSAPPLKNEQGQFWDESDLVSAPGIGTCQEDLGICHAGKATCEANLGICQSDLATRTDELGACHGDLAVCQACGDGIVDSGESCDGADFGGATCATLGFAGGTVRCGSGCSFDTSGCLATRFVDNGDGTVTDNQTGLQWEKKTTAVGSGSNDADPHDVDNWYSWTVTGTAPDGTVFTDFLATLNTAPCFADHCDWRLPSEEGRNVPYGPTELEGILEMTVAGCGAGSACIDPVFGPTFPYGHWSGTTTAGASDHAWGVDFGGDHGNGLVGPGWKPADNLVRAVRSGP